MCIGIAGVGVQLATDNYRGALCRSCSVVGLIDVAGGNGQQSRIDRTDGVVYIGNDVVVATVAVAHDNAGDSNRLTGSRVCIGVGKRATTQAVLLVTIACVGVQRAAGNHRHAYSSQRAIISFGDVAAAHRQCRWIDRTVCVAHVGDDVVVSAVAVVYSDTGYGDRLAGPCVRVSKGERTATQGI